MLLNLVTLLPSLLYSGNLFLADFPSIPPRIHDRTSGPSMVATTAPASLSEAVVPSPPSNAARLFLNPSSSGGGPITFRNRRAMQQIQNQQTLQDDRLNQCEEKVEDFEQCFFYGTGQGPDPDTNSHSTKSKVPTW